MQVYLHIQYLWQRYLLYDAEIVPVGKDQKQHLEMTRDMARAFNHIYGNTLTEPEESIDKRVMIIPGTDGQKMSKSYNNFINIFLPDKKLRKQIMRIQTDSTPMEDPKETENCNVFKLYALLASNEQIKETEQITMEVTMDMVMQNKLCTNLYAINMQ